MSQALEGLLILDLSRVLAGPYCTMVLGDFGAEVIKVENPEGGDETRHWGPPWAGGESAYFLAVNRNKRSLTLNLKHPQGREILRDLACRSDVLIENFKVGTLDRLGVSVQELMALNPGLITCSLTGYGQDGPYKDRPGYDFAIQAEGGLMSITGPASGSPTKVGVAIADIAAGLFAANAILSALHHRERTGEGQAIDLSLFETQLAWLANTAQNYLVSGEAPRRYGNAHPNIVPYQTFKTQDGCLALAIGNNAQFQRFCQVAGRPELSQDERFRDNPGRVEHREALLPLVEALLVKRSSAEWLETLAAAGVPAAPVNTIPEALDHPQTTARGLLQEMDHPAAGRIRLIGPPARLSKTPPRISRPPPRLGEHSEEVLAEILGYADAEIARLREQGVF